MPDLSGLDLPVIRKLLFNITFRGRGIPRDATASIYLVGFIRMVDKALYEYTAARQALNEHLAPDGPMLPALRSVDHLETCINATRRALNYIERLKSHQHGPTISRTIRRWLNANAQEIPAIRNTVEHIDEIVAKGEIGQGQAVALAISHDGRSASIAGYTIGFGELSTILKKLHGVSLELADYQEFSSS